MGLLVGWPPGLIACRRRWSQPGSAGPAKRLDGQPPGPLGCSGCSATPIVAGMSRTRVYRNGVLEAENFPVAEVSDYLADPATVVWFDLCEPTATDLESIREELGLHELAVEDALEDHERSKLDRYKTHLFVVAYSVALDTATGDLAAHEVAAFITHDALVTVRKDRGFDIDDVLRRWDNTNVGAVTVGFLLYGLLDHVIDSQLEAVQSLDAEIEALEDQLFADNPRDKDVQRRTFALRKSLVKLRRLALPMREVVTSLMRRDVDLVDPDLMPYYQDLYDHVLRATEWTESLREMVTAILEPAHRARQPAQRDHEAGHQLGCDHRRAHCRDRLLRAERATPDLGIRPGSGRPRSSSWACPPRSMSYSAAKGGFEHAIARTRLLQRIDTV